MNVFRVYKGEVGGVRLTLVPSHKDTKIITVNKWHQEVNTCAAFAFKDHLVTRFNFYLIVEALNWPKNEALPATVNSACVVTTWLNSIHSMPKHVTINHRLVDEKGPGAITEWYNNICVARYGCDSDDEVMGLFWGTDNLKAVYAVEITEYGIDVDLSHQLRDIREFSEENFEKYGVLTPQDPNVHGRTPWRIFDPGKDDPWRELSIVDADNNTVTTLGPLEDTTDMTLGNALFILNCVNDKGDLAMTVGQLEAEVDSLKKERDRLHAELYGNAKGV